MSDLDFQPLIPSALWLVLAVAAGGAMIWYASSRPAGVGRWAWRTMVALMTTVMAVVLVVLLNPTWSHQIEPPGGKPVLTVLIDGSGSMATPDAAGGATRFTAAGQFASSVASSLSEQFDVRVCEFDRSVKTIDIGDLAAAQPTGPSTDLEAAIKSATEQEHAQGQAVVLLSDGIDNAGAVARVLKAARVAKSIECPIYTRTFGGDIQTNDLAIELRSSQDLAIAGQKLPLTATISHHGVTSGKTIVTLLQDGREVDRRAVLLDPTGPSDVHFMISQDKVGVYPYELALQPMPGQTSLASTTATYLLRVVDEPVRVLVLEGKPYWDSKFFIRTLAADPAVAVDAITRISDGRLMERMISHASASDGHDDAKETWNILTDPKSFLASVDRLNGYQIVVLGRDVGPFLDDNAITNLQTWIAQQGGSLVCYRGSPMDQRDPRLEKLLPVDWSTAEPSRSRMALTQQGKSLNWVQGDGGSDDPLPRLPSLGGAQSVNSTKPLAVVLATSTLADGTQSPAVVYQQYGTGRVLSIEGSGMWRWAFLPPQYQDQEQAYASLWQSMMRWLSSSGNLTPGQLCSLRTDQTRFGTDQPATATLLVREGKDKASVPPVELVMMGGSASAKIISPAPIGTQAGIYRVNFGPLLEGKYQAKVRGAKDDDPSSRIMFEVRRYDQEEVDLQARPDLMQRIASDSGGGVLGAADPVGDLTTQFKHAISRAHPPQIEHTSAWDRWWLLMGVLGIWGISWALRRSGGLI